MIADEVADRIGAARVRDVIDALHRQAQDDLPRDVSIERTSEGLVVSGRRLRVRSLADVRLRRIGR